MDAALVTAFIVAARRATIGVARPRPGIAGPGIAGPGIAGPGIAGPGIAGPGIAGTAIPFGRAAPAAMGVGPGPAGSHPAGSSTGWVTRCGAAPWVTTRASTATNAVNRHSTPYRSETSVIWRSSRTSSARAISAPAISTPAISAGP